MQRAQEPVEPSGPTPSPDYRMVQDKKLARRAPGTRLVVAGLVLPALLAAGGGFLVGPDAEDALEQDTTRALKAEGVRGVKVEADGPFVTAYVPTKVDPLRASRVVEAVPGVSAVTTERVFASKKEAQACAKLKSKLDKATGKQRIPFVGRTSRLTATGQAMVKEAARLVAACGSARVYVGAHTDSSTPRGSTLTIKRARTMIDLMRKVGVPEERLVPRGYGAQYPVGEAKQRNERGSILPVQG